MSRPVTTAAAAILAIAASSAFAQGKATLSVAASGTHGNYLVGPSGLPIYMFETDRRGDRGRPPAISCSGDCLDAWPLVTVSGRFGISPTLDPALVGTVRHRGAMVVTYSGWPLYTYAPDAPGEPPRGQGVDSFGGKWYLLSPAGEIIGN